MAIRANPNTYIPTDGTYGSHTWCWYRWLKWMKQASPDGPGWTVKASYNGSSYGAGDQFSETASTGVSQLHYYSSATNRAWFVLQAPDGRELLIYKEAATAGQFRMTYSPSAGFTGGTQTPPTATDGVFVSNSAPAHGSWTGVLHMAADDAAPYGFWAYAHTAGNVGYAEFCIAQCPMDVVAVTGDTDPFVTWFWNTYVTSGGMTATYLCSESVSYAYIWRSTKADGTSSSTLAALYLRSNTADAYIFPGKVDLLPTGEDVSMPITLVRSASSGGGYFKGISSWFQWNGYVRAPGEMFDTRARVSIGDLNVPWDGASDWLSS